MNLFDQIFQKVGISMKEEKVQELVNTLQIAMNFHIKNYGNSLVQTVHEFGEVAFITSLHEKVNRCKFLVHDFEDETDEKLLATLLEIATISLIAYNWLDEAVHGIPTEGL